MFDLLVQHISYSGLNRSRIFSKPNAQRCDIGVCVCVPPNPFGFSTIRSPPHPCNPSLAWLQLACQLYSWRHLLCSGFQSTHASVPPPASHPSSGYVDETLPSPPLLPLPLLLLSPFSFLLSFCLFCSLLKPLCPLLQLP